MHTYTSIMVEAYRQATGKSLQDSINLLGISSLVGPEDIQQLSPIHEHTVKAILNDHALISQWTR